MITKWRKEVFDIINSSDKPLRAEDIYKQNGLKPNLSTVYRALNYLEKKDYISSVSFEGNVRYYFAKNKHYHFLICKNCGKIEVFTECMANEIKKQIEERFNFEITDHVFYFKGLCNECKKGGGKNEKDD